jgi:hypothetical protein
MAMAYPVEEEIRVVRNNQAIEAQFPIPPGVVGHDPGYRSAVKYDPAGANALLDKFGYKKGADGYRTLPDGKPLVIRYASRPDSLGRQQDELWQKAFAGIGIKMEVQKDKFAELLKLEKQCKLMMRTASWIADYPDADNFMQLGCRTRSSATSSTAKWPRSSRPTPPGGSISAAIGTCWRSRGCRDSRNTRSCTTSGSILTWRGHPPSDGWPRSAQDAGGGRQLAAVRGREPKTGESGGLPSSRGGRFRSGPIAARSGMGWRNGSFEESRPPRPLDMTFD